MRRLPSRGARHEVVARLDPIRQRVADIHPGVAEGGELPVENADDAGGVIAVEHDVVESVIVVRHADRLLRGDVGLEPPHDYRPARHVPRASLAIAFTPALDLPPRIAGAFAEMLEPGGAVVHL